MTTNPKICSLFLLVLVMCSLVLFLSACSKQYIMTDRGIQAYYQTGFPVHDTSQELERIFHSIKRIMITGYYRVYIFPEDSYITEAQLRNPQTYNRAVETFSTDHTKAGTATIVSVTSTKMGLITNQHIIDFPDTLKLFFHDEQRTPRRYQTEGYIQSVAIKTNQVNIIYDLPHLGPFEVIAEDKARDIALIGVDLTGSRALLRESSLTVTIGDPSKLVWGSFVYVLGYPKGYKMVTRAIVSDPNRDRVASFLLDGLFNEGISGGLILAVRGDTGELEWVGMARAGSATTEYILLPDVKEKPEQGLILPYKGDLYVQSIPRIDYGITLSVSMKAIQRFISEHERELRRKGYFITTF